MPTSTQLTVTRQNMNDGLYEALFVSELQQSDNPTTNMVAEAISRTMQRFGTDGCAGQMAQEFGDHPDGASERMRWVRQLAVRAGLTDSPPTMTLRRDGWRHERDVCRYEPAVRKPDMNMQVLARPPRRRHREPFATLRRHITGKAVDKRH